jgi:FKBP-type peptidyl-prolyl cis-trans isomerase FklB
MKLKNIVLASALGFFSLVSCNGQKKMKKSDVKLETQKDKVSYSIGISIGENLKTEGLDTVINVDLLAKAIQSVFKKDSLAIDQTAANQLLQEYFTGIQKSKGEENQKANDKFMQENKSKPGVITLPSGLQYIVEKEGTGAMPKITDNVTTHYHGSLVNGKVFDSSVERGQPASFGVNQVIPGWTEALQLMKVGSKWKIFIPSNLGYGEQGAGKMIPPNSALIFELELLGINAAANPQGNHQGHGPDEDIDIKNK